MKARSMSLLVLAEVSAMSLWFVTSAILVDLRQEVVLGKVQEAMLVSGVAAGFVVGALFVAMSGIADRFDARRVFAVSALLAAFANAGMLLVEPGGAVAISLRVITGFALAGVYPVGMKIAVGWGVADRGWLVGLLVGGLTLGSAAPHLLAFLGGSNWRLTTVVASALAVVSAITVLCVRLGPNHVVSVRMDPRVITVAWTDTRLRKAFLGYLGHMWELYALWAWIAPATAASYLLQTDATTATQWSKLTAFVAIGLGAVLCPFAGKVADVVGKAELTIIVMCCSGLSALLAALVFGGPVWAVSLVFVLWGLSVIPDSAQFSAMVADLSPPQISGSLMSLQTALGFALTIFTVQMTPLLADVLGWPALFCILALGPLTGIIAMAGLTRSKLGSGV